MRKNSYFIKFITTQNPNKFESALVPGIAHCYYLFFIINKIERELVPRDPNCFYL